jgi:hypothetical protein
VRAEVGGGLGHAQVRSIGPCREGRAGSHDPDRPGGAACGSRIRSGAASRGDFGAEHRVEMIAHGIPIYVALEPVNMRFGFERLGGWIREKMQAEPRSRALFVFVGKRGHTMKVLTWDGTQGLHRVVPPPLHGKAETRCASSFKSATTHKPIASNPSRGRKCNWFRCGDRADHCRSRQGRPGRPGTGDPTVQRSDTRFPTGTSTSRTAPRQAQISHTCSLRRGAGSVPRRPFRQPRRSDHRTGAAPCNWERGRSRTARRFAA